MGDIWSQMAGLAVFGLAVLLLHIIITFFKKKIIKKIEDDRDEKIREIEEEEKFYGAPW